MSRSRRRSRVQHWPDSKTQEDRTTDKERRAAFALAATYLEGNARLEMLDKAASDRDKGDKGSQAKAKEEENLRK